MEKYDSYKDSGVEWIGEIPVHWNVKKLKFSANVVLGKMLCNSDKGNYQLKPYLKSKNIQWMNVDVSSVDQMWFSPAEIIQYKIEKGDLLLSEGGEVGKTCIWNEELSECYIQNSVHKVSFYDDCNSIYFLNQFYVFGKHGAFDSIVNRVSIAHLTKDKLENIDVVIPPLSEQLKIAAYLNQMNAQIDRAIAQKERLIALLKERKQIVIQQAVTKGLDPTVKMKDSGVEWMRSASASGGGEVPEHWEVKKLKYVLTERKERSETGDETLFMVSQVHGLVVRSDFHEKAEVALSNVGNKMVYLNDLVFNKLKAHLGVFFKSTIQEVGLVSPDYAVYKSLGLIKDMKYLELLFRHPSYIEQFIIRATGIVEGLIRLYTGDLFDIEVPVPPHDEQAEILDYIATQSLRIEKSIHLHTQQIAKLKEYRTVLIDAAVTGKMKVE